MIVAKERGFTIIELMLFFGVTGALFAALMFGVNASVNQQRYRESVVSLGALLQGQYSEVSNTRNDSNNDWSCTTNGNVEQDGTAPLFRGTSPCVLLGKSIEIKNGNQISIRRVVGCEPSRPGGDASAGCGNTSTQEAASTNDLDTLKLYNPKKTDFDKRNESPEWDSSLRDTTEKHDALTASFLILRSPSSGLLRIFTTTGELPSDLKTVITQDAAKAKLPMCIFGDSIISAKQSITIDPLISGPDGVRINQSDGELCG